MQTTPPLPNHRRNSDSKRNIPKVLRRERENLMEEKGAEVMTQKAPEKEAAAAMACYRRTVGEEATFKERSKDLFRQFKDAPAGDHWVCLKNKVRAAGEYAILRTRQGITMFGEPNVGDLFGSTKDDDSKKTPSA